MSLVILDIDNCIADDHWRLKHIHFGITDNFRRFHDYHSLSSFDKPGNQHLFAKGGASEGHDIALFTSRPSIYRAQTNMWMRFRGARYKHLLMRNAGDHRSSVDVKLTQLNWLLAHYDVAKAEIAMAYDDREDVVEMYHQQGLNAQVVFINPPEAECRQQIK